VLYLCIKNVSHRERQFEDKTVRTEHKIQEIAMLLRANRSQSVDEIAAAAEIRLGTCHRLLFDDLKCVVVPSSVFETSWCKTNVMIARPLAMT
jgi:hypothetical protein